MVLESLGNPLPEAANWWPQPASHNAPSIHPNAQLIRLPNVPLLAFVPQMQTLGQLVEHAVDETPRFLVAVALGQLDRLVHRDPRRNISHPQQLVERDTQNVVIDARQPSDRPMLQDVSKMAIERCMLALDALDQLRGELARALVSLEALEQQEQILARRAAANIDLIKGLERKLTPQMSKSHGLETAGP